MKIGFGDISPIDVHDRKFDPLVLTPVHLSFQPGRYAIGILPQQRAIAESIEAAYDEPLRRRPTFQGLPRLPATHLETGVELDRKVSVGDKHPIAGACMLVQIIDHSLDWPRFVASDFVEMISQRKPEIERRKTPFAAKLRLRR